MNLSYHSKHDSILGDLNAEMASTAKVQFSFMQAEFGNDFLLFQSAVLCM